MSTPESTPGDQIDLIIEGLSDPMRQAVRLAMPRALRLKSNVRRATRSALIQRGLVSGPESSLTPLGQGVRARLLYGGDDG